MNNKENLELIKIGCAELELELNQEQHSKLNQYIELLIKWNKVYNLTAIKNSKDIVIRHILDSLSIIKYISTNQVNLNIIDIGSGAGLPGIVMAIACPSYQVTLLDSNSKKMAFVQQVKTALKLTNVNVVTDRAEKYSPNEKFDATVSRAFASLADFVKVTSHLLKPDAQIWAMKGKVLPQEVSDFNNLYNDFEIRNIFPLSVPLLAEDRNLIEIIKK